jgi:hypothetical protein
MEDAFSDTRNFLVAIMICVPLAVVGLILSELYGMEMLNRFSIGMLAAVVGAIIGWTLRSTDWPIMAAWKSGRRFSVSSPA